MVIIIFPGKGGTGKTTLTALTIKYFTEKDEVTLALDFDPDSHPVSYTHLTLPTKA